MKSGLRNLLIAVSMLLPSQALFSQITLEYSHPVKVSPVFRSYAGDVCKYSYFDKNTNIFYLYNLDHSVYKAIPIDNLPEGSELFSDPLSLNVNDINDDELVEFYYTVNMKDRKYISYLCNENGELIKQFDDVFILSLVRTEEGMKLSAEKGGNSGEDYYSITKTAGTKSLSVESKAAAYPSPAREKVNIPYRVGEGETATVSVYDRSGRLCEEKTVDSRFNSLRLDVSGYTPGLYFFTCKGERGEFIVN